jgi:hypothetical protein
MAWMPFRMLQRLLRGTAWLLRSRAPVAPVSAERVVWAVKAASKRTVGPTTCLVEALAAQAVLAAHGHAAKLRLGVARAGTEGSVQAHAWVESEGSVVIGGSAADLDRFHRFPDFDEHQRSTVAVSPKSTRATAAGGTQA